MPAPESQNRRPQPAPLTDQILSKSQSSREVIQEFVPLAESLEWDLGQQYLRQRGNKAFISDASPVPYVINNNGSLSRNAAEVFFTSLLEADKAGMLGKEIHVLELGIGVGLFSRYFLDHVQELSKQHKKDYYHRLTYIAADRSERMLTDVLRHGVWANHPGRVRVRQIDAMQPEVVARDLCFHSHVGAVSHSKRGENGTLSQDSRSESPKPLRAVFLNYLLDCLPAAVLKKEDDTAQQLHVRTCVARNVRLKDYTDLSAEQLRKRVAKGDEKSMRDLLEVYGLFASEYDYRPVELVTLPYAALAEARLRLSKHLLHSYGAIQCLERLLELVTDDGFILVNDYGTTQISSEDHFEHQRFSLATFVGVNFPLLEAYFGDEKRCQVVKAPGDSRGIHSRLFSKKPSVETVVRFQEGFKESAHQDLQEPINHARGCAKAGRFELASSYYQEALKKQPRDWVLINEVSMFLTFSMRDPMAGANLAKVALGLNPTLSAELWCTLGDALFEWNRTAEARGAYEKALSVNSADVRSRYNLAWVHARERNFDAALKRIAEAFTLDKTGEYRDRLMQKLQEVLQMLSRRHQQEYLLLINLVSKYSKPKEGETPSEPGDKQS